jgi:hypothetical protein
MIAGYIATLEEDSLAIPADNLETFLVNGMNKIPEVFGKSRIKALQNSGFY